MRGLILDDKRSAEDCCAETGRPIYQRIDWDVVKSYDEFVEYIENNPLPDVISFDHDLCDEHYKIGADHNWWGFNYDLCTVNTGYHAACWLTKRFEETGEYCELLVHSANPYGTRKILKEIHRFLLERQYGKGFFRE